MKKQKSDLAQAIGMKLKGFRPWPVLPTVERILPLLKCILRKTFSGYSLFSFYWIIYLLHIEVVM
jgi:hypothetical protein